MIIGFCSFSISNSICTLVWKWLIITSRTSFSIKGHFVRTWPSCLLKITMIGCRCRFLIYSLIKSIPCPLSGFQYILPTLPNLGFIVFKNIGISCWFHSCVNYSYWWSATLSFNLHPWLVHYCSCKNLLH